MIAKGRITVPRGMTRIERDYGEHLLAAKAEGGIAWYAYEGLTLKLADDCRYTPDFVVMVHDGEMELHETKGPYAREDSLIKLRLAARLFPFRVYLVTREGDRWRFKLVTP
jgi:hypothetical protein